MLIVRIMAAGIFLCSAVLVAAPGAFSADKKKVGISMIVEVPQLTETKDGVLEALSSRGFVNGKNIVVDYQNANGNIPTQQQIAKKFVGENMDIIVAITTPTAQAMVATTKDIPIVFATVTDPLAAKLIPQYKHPGANVTGVSDEAPLAEQLKLFAKIKPSLKKLGFIYNPGLDGSKATLAKLRDVAADAGIAIVEVAAPTTNEVVIAARKLVGAVDAIYVPNDTTVVAALEAIVKVGEETSTPVFVGETRGVERGAAASVGLNYTEVGLVAGNMVADILSGQKPGDIDAVIAHEVIPKLLVIINKGAAKRMGSDVPADVLATATRVIQ